MMTKTKLSIELKKAICKPGNNENCIQRIMEEHPELVPLPFLLNHRLHFNLLIKKLELPNNQITDFAYFTKSTVEWNAVLIELESSNKKIFTKNKKKIIFTSDFNNAYDQIVSWKSYLIKNVDTFKKSIKELLFHMNDNVLNFKFVLIIGRNSDLSSQEKRDMFNQKNTSDIKVMTYDSVLNHLASNPISNKILSKKTIQGYELLNLNNSSTSLFAFLGKDNLVFNNVIKKELINKGYNISEWEKGELLELNDKEPMKNFKLK